ncbi:MAG: hypothetical protein AAGA48_14005 [Myxococcota bacterium]
MISDPSAEVPARTWRLGLIAVALVAGVLPFLPIVFWLPWGADASKWIAWASIDSGGWWEGVTNRKHFVGYRPVAAFSYVVNHWTTGYAAWGYRGLDLLLHGLSSVLVALTARQWMAPRPPHRLDRATLLGVFVMVMVVLGHPAAEEVVPYSARRSYLLSLCFGLGSVLTFGSAVLASTRIGWLGFGAAAALMGLAVLSNESAYVLVPLLPMVGLHLAWSSDPPGPHIRRGLVGYLPTLGVTAVAIGLRYTVLGSLSGGYHRRYFAFVNASGRPAWQELSDWQPLRIFYACLSYLLHPHGVGGRGFLGDTILHLPILLVGVAFLSWMMVRAVIHREDPAARSVGLAMAWLGGSMTIIVLSQTWFWRQAYWMLPPYGLLLGVAFIHAARASNRRVRWSFAAPALLLGLLAMIHGPVLRFGMNTKAQRDRSYGTAATLALRDAIQTLDQPTDVLLVVPLKASRARLARIWQGRFFHDAGHRFHLMAHLDRGLRADTTRPAIRRREDALVLRGGYWLTDRYREHAETRPSPAEPGSRPVQRLPLDAIASEERPISVVAPPPSPFQVTLPPTARPNQGPTPAQAPPSSPSSAPTTIPPNPRPSRK